MISCPIFWRSDNEARVFSTQRRSAAGRAVIAPGLAGPSRRRDEASTPRSIAGWMVVETGAQAIAITAPTIRSLSFMADNHDAVDRVRKEGGGRTGKPLAFLTLPVRV